MSATVAGCGHAECFVETDFLTKQPQVHFHFFTDDDTFDEMGYGKMELCCHGCGNAVLMYYNDHTAVGKKHLTVRNSFSKLHKKCTNREYETRCPPIRIGIEVVDLRTKKKKRVLTKSKQIK